MPLQMAATQLFNSLSAKLEGAHTQSKLLLPPKRLGGLRLCVPHPETIRLGNLIFRFKKLEFL